MTKRACGLLLAAALLAPALASGQAGRREEERVPDLPKDARDGEEVVRVKALLVELSAVVTDRAGAPVSDLRKEDFELFENDRPREITFFSVERVGGASPGAGGGGLLPPANAAGAPAGSPGAPAAPPAPATPSGGRAVVLFVDTLHLTAGGLAQAKRALRRFIDEQMSGRDVAAVVSTSGGGGLLGQFTNDRQLLRLAVERLQPQFAQTPSFFTPHLAASVVRDDNLDGEAVTLAAKLVRAEDGMNAFVPGAGTLPSDYPQRVYARQKAMVILGEAVQRRRVALSTLRAAAEQLARLPGQRVVAYFSEGFTQADSRGETDTSDVEQAVGRAARSGVVVHAFDVRGLAPNPVFDVSAGDVSSGGVATQLSGYLAESVTESQNGMNALAKETGGEAFFDRNDLGASLSRALEAGRVYYRIAYQSPGEGGGKFRRVTLRLKNRPELKVRTQRGFRADPPEAEAQTPQQRFVRALLSPLPSTAIPVSTTAQFFVGGTDVAQVSFRALVDASALDFREQADRRLALDLETVTAVYDLGGKLVRSFPETVRSQLAPARAELLRRQGLESVKRLSLKPGLYQIRFGVRELSTERVGTSSVVVEVPDLSAGKLTLSSIFLREDLNQSAPAGGAGVAGEPPRARQRHGLRLYRRGEALIYQLRVYNVGPQGEGALSLQLDLRQGDRPLHTGEWQPVAPLVVARDARGVEIGGQLRTSLPPGLYELGLTVRDERRKQTVRGSVPFAVEPAPAN
jgi:VWFA-related protein